MKLASRFITLSDGRCATSGMSHNMDPVVYYLRGVATVCFSLFRGDCTVCRVFNEGNKKRNLLSSMIHFLW